VLLTNYYSGDQPVKIDMDKACCRCRGKVRCLQFWQGNLREKDHLEDQGRDWRTVLKLTLQNMMGGKSMNWIDLAQDRIRWQALLNVVMKFGFHKMQGITSLAEELLAAQQGLCSI
jgi:hypothetical protein